MPSFSDVRQAISTAVLVTGGDWNASPVPYALFGPDAVPDAVPASKAHLAFAIGIESEATSERQKITDNIDTESSISVRFFSRFTPLDGIASEDAALDHEHDLIKAVRATSGVRVLWSRSIRDMVASGEWFIHEVVFTAYHRIALS
jgi:hypothetical protein